MSSSNKKRAAGKQRAKAKQEQKRAQKAGESMPKRGKGRK